MKHLQQLFTTNSVNGLSLTTKKCDNSSLSAEDRDNLRVGALPPAHPRDGRPLHHLPAAASLQVLPLPPPAEEGGGVPGDQSQPPAQPPPGPGKYFSLQ